jgi:transcriptional regulator with XRE-family HTH domain
VDKPAAVRRTTAAQRTGAARASYVARRVGTGLREARLARGLRQQDVADRAGISQSYLSDLERGRQPGASLQVLANCAASVDAQLAAFIEGHPGAEAPRDLEHLRRQAMLVQYAARGGWSGATEALVGDLPRPQSIDVLLTRPARREACVTEIWNWLPDGGDAIRGLDRKVLATRARLGPDWRVQGLLLMRRTRRNQVLVREISPLLHAHFPASSAGWLAALRDLGVAMPDGDGFAWTTVDGKRLILARLR